MGTVQNKEETKEDAIIPQNAKTIIIVLGYAIAPTPPALCRETHPPQWLPNLHLFLYFQSDKKGLIHSLVKREHPKY